MTPIKVDEYTTVFAELVGAVSIANGAGWFNLTIHLLGGGAVVVEGGPIEMSDPTWLDRAQSQRDEVVALIAAVPASPLRGAP